VTTVPLRILPVGDLALLAEVSSLAEVLALRSALAASAPAGVVELVPAARTVLVRIDPAALSLAAARTWITAAARSAATGAGATEPHPPSVEIEIAYDGPDLTETAALLHVAPEELVRRHRDARWTVAFTGFAPGFGYLVSDDWPYDVPRLESPRTRVPAGAVGLAAGFTGAYPRPTPGGWRLVGTTAAPLFDPASASPVLLAPGTQVRFREVDAVSPRPSAASSPPDPAHDSGFRVLAAGPQAPVQDLGRPGVASLGVATSGALDREALRLGNRLVGNRGDAAGIEVVLGGFRAVADRNLWVAVTGASGPGTIDGRPLPAATAVPWPAGSELSLGWVTGGARAYLAVRGGVAGERIFGSLATDVLAGLGTVLMPGASVPIGEQDAVPIPAVDLALTSTRRDVADVELLPGPRGDWFPASAVADLYRAEWAVSADADRVGMRLEGPALPRAVAGELPSEGMVPGAIQVPPSGRPTILLVDGPVTGGYPVIAVATEAALDVLAQARPGDLVRFRRGRLPR
jgi:KipI family sensor histidine kinase inhibitor